MKIIASQQQNKKLSIIFDDSENRGIPHRGRKDSRNQAHVDKFAIDKAEEFLGVVDRFIKKRKIDLVSLRKADLEFENTGMLTERVIRAIMLGLCF